MKDFRDSHFKMSIIKSTLRGAAATSLVVEAFVLAGTLFLLAEIFGVLEEL